MVLNRGVQKDWIKINSQSHLVRTASDYQSVASSAETIFAKKSQEISVVRVT